MLCCGAGGGGSDPDSAKFKVIESRWNVQQKSQLGEGGFGTVYLAKSTKSGKTRACKAMRLACALDREDFRNEVMILNQ